MATHGKHTDVSHLVKDLLKETHEEYEEESVAMPGASHSSTPSKEHEPVGSRERLIIEQAREHEPSEELELHLEARQEIPKLDQELTQEGVTATPTTAFPTFEEVKLPLSDEKVVEGLEEPVTSSWRWLSEFCMHLLHLAHQTLKSVQGKATRMAIETKN
jgi:hypothetical protein